MTKKRPKPTRLHLGCGTVYLKDFFNIDVHIPGWSFLASDRPDLVKKNLTTVDNYYGSNIHKNIKRSDFETKRFEKRPIVCDFFANAKALPHPPNQADEIRSVQLFEHFSFNEGRKLLAHWKNILKPGGKVHIDIPDLDETIKGYYHAKTQKDKDWYTRLLFGSQKNEYGFHKGMYSKQSIQTLLAGLNFTNIKFLPNIHVYPAFAVEAVK